MTTFPKLKHSYIISFSPNVGVQFAFDITQPNLDSDGAIYKEIKSGISRELQYDIKA